MSTISLDPINIAEGTTPTTSPPLATHPHVRSAAQCFRQIDDHGGPVHQRGVCQGQAHRQDYATVYLGGMTGVLQAAIAYLTLDKEIEKFNAEIKKLTLRSACYGRKP